MIALFQEVRSVARLQMQLSAAIRGELNLTTDMAAYETRLQENFERMDFVVQGLLAHLDEGSQLVQAQDASRHGLIQPFDVTNTRSGLLVVLRNANHSCCFLPSVCSELKSFRIWTLSRILKVF